MNITAKTKVCMVIGDPVEHSLGPVIYNEIYKKLGIEDQFVYVASNVTTDMIEDCIKGVRAMGIRGVSCTIPHKQAVMVFLDEIDGVAARIGAVNTIVQNDGKLKGYNTDWHGVIKPIEQITSLTGKKVALLGAGGAARAAGFGIADRGASLTIFNRSFDKAQKLANELGAFAKTLEELEGVKSADIIINTTSVGMSPADKETPLPKEFITSNHLVFDAVYTPYATQLMRDAKEQGATVIHGTEMLIYQGIEQFKLYTGHNLPVETMRQTLHKILNIEAGK